MRPGAHRRLPPARHGQDELFPTVVHDGVLPPQRPFSMGEACDKRFYLEAREDPMRLTIPAYAKINLTLDVLGKAAGRLPRSEHGHAVGEPGRSGHHPGGPGKKGFTLKTDLGFLPGADKNIAGVAARAFARHRGRSERAGGSSCKSTFRLP